MAAIPMECVVAVAPAEPDECGKPSRSPVYRNAGCDVSLPLASIWEGKSTLLQTFESTVSKQANRPFLGTPCRDSRGRVSYQWQTYWEASLVVQWLAKSMFSLGVRPGARVGILGPNAPHWVQAMIACSKAAAVCVPLYPTFGRDAMHHVVVQSGMELAFVHYTDLPVLLEAMRHSTAPDQEQQGQQGQQGHAASKQGPGKGGKEGSASAAGHRIRYLVLWGQQPSRTASEVTESCKALGVQLVLWEDFLQLWGSSELGVDFDQAMIPPQPEDLCTIMYTSGTTGPPKGVMFTHRAMVSSIASLLAFLDDPWANKGVAALQQEQQHQHQRPFEEERQGEGDAPAPPPAPPAPASSHPQAHRKPFPGNVKLDVENDTHLSYLPLAHIYERIMVEVVIAVGTKVGFWEGSVKKLQTDAQALGPAMMVGVPRVWEIIRQTTWERLLARTPISRFLFRWFSSIKLQRLKAGVPQHRAFWLGDFLVFRHVRAALGGRLKLAVSGSAPLSPETEEFMRVCLCCVAGQGYGLTETCCASCVVWPDRWDMFGTVGPVQSCAELRLVSVPEMGYDACPSSPGQLPRGEICFRGPCLFSGYYLDDKATREVMDEDGFFHTGDIGQLEASGALRIIDRKKSLIKLAQGEYISVERVEAVLRDCPLVFQAWVHGEPGGRRLMALVVPRFQALLAWGQQQQQQQQGQPQGEGTQAAAGGGAADMRAADAMQPALEKEQHRRVEAWCRDPRARAAVLAEVKAATQRAGLQGFERVYAVRLIPSEWTPSNGFLTPTHKLRRQQLRGSFHQEIKEMVQEIGDT